MTQELKLLPACNTSISYQCADLCPGCSVSNSLLTYLGKQPVALPPTWETRIEFQSAGFNQAQLGTNAIIQGIKQQVEDLLPSVYPSLSFCFLDK